MGCCHSKKKQSPETKAPEQKQYSWDKRETVDPSHYILDGICDSTIVRGPGSIDGQQFIVQNCQNSKIFLLDHMATITIDDCIGCQFVFGPVNGSVFFRDCKECKCMVACQQFRTRDCMKMDVFLFCTTQPIIESSSRFQIGCYQLSYPGLKDQFKQASLSLFNNNWSNIHDFTPVPMENNWIVMPENTNILELFDLSGKLRKTDNGGEMGNNDSLLPFVVSTDDSVIPLTRGRRDRDLDDSCFVIVFHHDGAIDVALKVIETLKSKLELIQTKEVILSSEDASRIFGSGSSKIWESVKTGPIIGLEFNGEDAIVVCSSAIAEMQTSQNHLYSSPSTSVAFREIQNFYNFCDMQLTG